MATTPKDCVAHTAEPEDLNDATQNEGERYMDTGTWARTFIEQ